MNQKVLGKLGEEIAVCYLEANQYKILEKNFYFHHKEIDIIAKKKQTIVFIEVKLRTNEKYGLPIEAVTMQKKRNICYVATYYLAKNNLLENPIQFDVIEILINEKQSFLKHTENYEM